MTSAPAPSTMTSAAPPAPPRRGAVASALPPLIPAGACFEGLLALPGPARIDGAVRGQIVGRGSLWIGATANVEASLDVEVLVVAGQVRGEVRAQRRVELLAGAAVDADLETPSLRVAEGSRWNGRSRSGRTR